jgi:16S rRNA (guanine(966)-N(2))-methyltransferase RsmD
LDDARVLDGFAGSGALGVEALSRGAREVLFVDADARAVDLIAENLRHCGIAEGCAMIRGALASVLDQLPAHRHFDLVLLDPPYDDADLGGVLSAAAARLVEGGILVLEHAARRVVPAEAGRLARVRRVKAGASALTFYRQPDAPPSGATEER